LHEGSGAEQPSGGVAATIAFEPHDVSQRRAPERDENEHESADEQISQRQRRLADEIRERVGHSLRAVLTDPNDPESPFFLLESVEIRIKLKRQGWIAKIARLVRPLVIISPQRLTEMLLNGARERGHVAARVHISPITMR
jgi:hypothetical protein